MFSRLPTSSKHLHHSLLFAATMFICSGCQLVAPTPADNATTLRHNEQLQAMYADLATTLSGYYAFGHSEFEVLAPDDAAPAANSSQGSSNQAAPVVLPLTKEQALAQALRQRGAAVCQSLGTCALKATPLHTDLTQTEEFTLLELFAPDLTLQRLYSARALPLGPVSVLGACAPIVTDMSASMAPPRGVTPPAMAHTTAPRASGMLVADTQVPPQQQQQQNLKLQPKQQTAARNNDRSAKNSAEVAVRAVATPASAQKPSPTTKHASTVPQQDTATPKGAAAALATTASKDVTPSTAASASGSSKAPVLTARNTSSKAAPEPEPQAASATASSTTVDIAVSDLAAPFTQRADATANAPHDTYGVTPMTTAESSHNNPGFALSDLKAKVASLAAEAEQREYAEQVASTVEALRNSSNSSSKHSGHSLQETPVFTAPAPATSNTTPQEHHKSAQPAAKQAPVVIPPEKLQFAFSPEKPQPRPTTTAAKPQQQQKQQQPEQGPTTAANDNTAKQRPAADKQVSAAGVAALTERYGLMSRQQPQREVPVFFSTTPGDRYSQRSSVHEMSPESLVSSLLRATGKSSSTISSSSNNHSATHLAVMTPLRLFVSSIK